MREKLIDYVKLLFAGTPNSEDMLQEILQNTLDRYDDLISQGKSPEAAYRLSISGIGDIGELMGNQEDTAAPDDRTDYRGRPLPSKRKKLLQALAIGLYICSVLPVIIFSSLGYPIWGVCLMFVFIAVATMLLILSPDNAHSEDNEKQKANKTTRNLIGTIGLIVYFVLSFSTQAWHITWLVFPIIGAVQGLVNAIKDLKEG